MGFTLLAAMKGLCGGAWLATFVAAGLTGNMLENLSKICPTVAWTLCAWRSATQAAASKAARQLSKPGRMHIL